MSTPDDRPIYYCARAMTVQDLYDIIDVMRDWLKELDTTQKYSMPNGHLWNAIDTASLRKQDK
jgi:hypothetical protein